MLIGLSNKILTIKIRYKIKSLMLQCISVCTCFKSKRKSNSCFVTINIGNF